MESKKPIGKKDHYLVVHNPRSGRNRKWDAAERACSFFHKNKLSSALLEINDVSLEKLQRFPNTKIVVLGGDGTLRSIYSFCHFNNLKLPIAFVPLGSANISARSFGTPLSFEKALGRAVAGKVKKIDCGIVNGKHLFTIAACFGKIAEVTVEAKNKDKAKYGAGAYFKKSGVFLKNYPNNSFSFQNGDSLTEFPTAHSVMVCNHFNIWGLSPKRRGIAADDGRLDVLIAVKPSLWGILRAIFDFYFRSGETKALEHHRIKSACMLGQDFDGKVHLDGEMIVLDNKNITLEVAPQSLNIIV